MRSTFFSSPRPTSSKSRAGFASFVATSPASRRCRMDGRRKSLLGRAIALARPRSKEDEAMPKRVLTGQAVSDKTDKTDRQRVVEGKGGYVRVYLGGRCRIKKKKQQ